MTTSREDAPTGSEDLPRTGLVELGGRTAFTISALLILVLNLMLVGLLALLGWLGWTSFLLLSGLGWLILGLMLEFGAGFVSPVAPGPEDDDPLPLLRPRLLLLPAWLVGWIMLAALAVRAWSWWGALAVLILSSWGFIIRSYLVGGFLRAPRAALAQARATLDHPDHPGRGLPAALRRAWFTTLFDQYRVAAAEHNIEVLRLYLEHLAPLFGEEEADLLRQGIDLLSLHRRLRGTVMIGTTVMMEITRVLDQLEQRQRDDVPDTDSPDATAPDAATQSPG